VAIGEQEVKRFDDLINYLSGHTSVGDRVTLTILRDGSQMVIEVTLQERPSDR